MSVCRSLIHTYAMGSAGFTKHFVNITFAVFTLLFFGNASAAANGFLYTKWYSIIQITLGYNSCTKHC